MNVTRIAPDDKGSTTRLVQKFSDFWKDKARRIQVIGINDWMNDLHWDWGIDPSECVLGWLPGSGRCAKLLARTSRRLSRWCCKAALCLRCCSVSASSRLTAAWRVSTCFRRALFCSSYSAEAFRSCRSSVSRTKTGQDHYRVVKGSKEFLYDLNGMVVQANLCCQRKNSDSTWLWLNSFKITNVS